MAKLKVGTAGGLIDQLLMRVGWKATAVVGDQERKDALHFLNWAEKEITQSEALSYLTVRTTIVLGASANSVAVPSAPAIDFSKDYWIETAASDGLIPLAAPDEFAALAGQNSTTGDRLTADPARHMVALDGATTTVKFFFKPAAGGAPLTFPITYQRIVPDLTDDGASESLLPEGYELTLLLMLAEKEIKRIRNEDGWTELRDEASAKLDAFYSKFRANKKTTQTDAGLERRKVEEDKLAPGR